MSVQSGVLNERDSGWLAGMIQRGVDAVTTEQLRMASPAYTLKPALAVDGNQWCALLGKDLQEGICGFGKSPADAYEDFNRSWYKNLRTKSEIPEHMGIYSEGVLGCKECGQLTHRGEEWQHEDDCSHFNCASYEWHVELEDSIRFCAGDVTIEVPRSVLEDLVGGDNSGPPK